ncbi:hypothetical protein [Niveibacterium sp. SC-1]|uniref:N-acyl amino acid synthase FeeM domain-containing protein n=1 Tax=Niveibacterium sp. SC-1 TaxID=3135646 RepID=UPI00311F342D
MKDLHAWALMETGDFLSVAQCSAAIPLGFASKGLRQTAFRSSPTSDSPVDVPDGAFLQSVSDLTQNAMACASHRQPRRQINAQGTPMHNRIDFSALHDTAQSRYLAPSNEQMMPAGSWHPGGAASDFQRQAGRGVVFELARTSEQVAMAKALVERQYRFAGFQVAHDRADGAIEGSGLTLLAMQGREAAATVTMRVDTAVGLLADTHYADELSMLRARGARLCEFIRFAANTEVSVLDLMGKLLCFAWHLAHERHGVTDVVVECHPRHAAFYRRTMGFRQAGPLTTCSRVDAPAVLLHLPLAHIAVGTRLAPRVAANHPSMPAARHAERRAQG